MRKNLKVKVREWLANKTRSKLDKSRYDDLIQNPIRNTKGITKESHAQQVHLNYLNL